MGQILPWDLGTELSLRSGEAGCICVTEAEFGSVLTSQLVKLEGDKMLGGVLICPI